MKMEILQEIISKTILLTDRLKLAIIHQDNLTKRGFDISGKGLSNKLEAFEKTYVSLEKEFQGLQEKVKKEKCKLAEISNEYKKVYEENSVLKETENSFLTTAKPTLERQTIAQELSNNLKIYKLLTGIRFDFKHAETILSGYIAISQNEPCKSTCIPFELNCNSHDCNEALWEKIKEACSDVIEYH